MLGSLIGIDREKNAKVAGIRTHFLVALGSSLYMIVSQHGFNDISGNPSLSVDVSRIAAQVVSGMGFIGAGMIVFEKKTVKGLTSAAGIWTTAGIGLAIGGGLYFLGISASILTLMAFELSTLLSKKSSPRTIAIDIETENEIQIQRILEICEGQNISLKKYEIKELSNTFYSLNIRCSISSKKIPFFLLEKIKAIPGVEVKKLLFIED